MFIYLFVYYYYYYYYYLHMKFSCSDNIIPETVKLNVTKRYILVDVVGVLALTGVASIFVRGGRKSDIIDFLYSP